MARYNEILVGRFNRAAQKLFGLKGDAPVASLMPEIGVTHNLFNGAENRYLEGWDRFGNAIVQAAVAGNKSAVRFRNPAGSNIIVVFEKLAVYVSVTGGLNVDLATINTDLGTAVPAAVAIDIRGRANAAVIASQEALAATNDVGGIIFGFAQPNANQSYDVIQFEDHELLLNPGRVLQVTTLGVNVALTVGAYWRERQLEESERA